MILGHLAIPILESHYLDADVVPTTAGGLFPDVLDKSVCQVLNISTHGRLWGHTVLGLVVSTLIVGALRDRRTAWSWALGYVGHLIADLESPIPILYPFATYSMPDSPPISETLHHFATDPARLLPELALVIWAAWILLHPKQRAKSLQTEA
jgi:hypothetical protein